MTTTKQTLSPERLLKALSTDRPAQTPRELYIEAIEVEMLKVNARLHRLEHALWSLDKGYDDIEDVKLYLGE